MGEYLILFKSLHIIGAVAWFGGMFYLVRVFVYHVEAFAKPEEERKVLLPQFELMEWRAYRIICTPGMVLTWIFGLLIIASYVDLQGIEWFKAQKWLHVKLAAVFLLSGYQGQCKKHMERLKKGEIPLNSFKMRLFNEVPTIALVLIVLLAVYKNYINASITLIGILIFMVVLVVFTKWYKKLREK